MDFYSIGLFVHIGAAIVLVGGSILATPAIRAAVLRATTLAELRGWLAAGRPLATINPLASFTMLGSGLHLTQAGGWWAAGWVRAAIVLWVANTAIVVAVVEPATHTLASTVNSAGDGPVGPAIDRLRRTRRWSVGHQVLLANDVGALYLMTNKPGYLGSVAAVVTAHGVVGALPALRRAFHRQRREWRRQPLPERTRRRATPPRRKRIHGQTTYRTVGWPVGHRAQRAAIGTERGWRRRAPQRVGRRQEADPGRQDRC